MIRACKKCNGCHDSLQPALPAGGRDWAPSRRSPGTRQRHFAGTNSKPRKLPEKAQTPTTIAPVLVGDRVHALLGGIFGSM